MGMKHTITTMATVAMILTSATTMAANPLEKEMEDYARDFYRAHPEAAGEDKVRDARQKMYNEAKQHRLLELTRDEEKKLRRRQDLIGKGNYNSTLGELKALNSQDPKITYLIKYAENPKIKGDEKLLAYRLMKFNYQRAAAQAAEDRSKRIHTILSQYTAYKQNNDGKAPASLDDLDLPEDCKKFTNSKGEKVDWIYIGHLGARLQANNSHVVIAEPEPLGSARICGLDSGEVARFNNKSIQPQLEKLAKAKGDGSGAANPDGNNAGDGESAAGSALAGLMKRYRIYKELNNNKEPESIDDLNLSDKDKKFTDPKTGEQLDWIFLGKNSRIQAGDGLKVIVVSPRAYNNYRLAGLSNGKVVKIPESKIGPMLKE